MAGSPFVKIDRLYEKEMRARAREANKNKPLVSCGILEFFQQATGFKPTSYQEKLLLDQNQFVVARWARQSGKSLTLAVICLYTVLSSPNVKVAILAPSLRQSRLMIRRISSFLPKLARNVLEGRALKTKLEFVNGSSIEAFPNSPETVRGLTCQLILCLPPDAKILLADGTTQRIDRLKAGQEVLSYNTFRNLSEPKRVLRVFRNPLGNRTIVRIHHENGTLECTGDHRIYTTNRGYVPAICLSTQDELIARQETGLEATIRQKVQRDPRTANTRGPPRRFFSQISRTSLKRIAYGTALVQASRICSVQVLSTEGVCSNSSEAPAERRLGDMEHTLQHSLPSNPYTILSLGISGRQENGHPRLAKQNSFSPRASSLVHGRRLPPQGHDKHCYTRFRLGPTTHAEGLARKQMGNPSRRLARQTSEGILSQLEGRGQRQAVRLNQAPHYSEYGLQDRSLEKVEMENGSANAQGPENSPMRDLPQSLPEEEFEAKSLQLQLQIGVQTSTSPHLRDPVQADTRIQPNTMADGSSDTSRIMQTLWDSLPATKWSSTSVFTAMPRHSDSEQPPSLRIEEKNRESQFVYDIEVEDNHNFFANNVLVSNCDEANYIEDDRDLYDAIVYTLGTTNGRLIATSTPGTRDSLFFEMCMNDEEYGDFSRHHVSFHDALEPNGPLKKAILEKLERQMQGDPWRWQREMLAEFSEDEEAWFSWGLISGCIDEDLEYVKDLNRRGEVNGAE